MKCSREAVGRSSTPALAEALEPRLLSAGDGAREVIGLEADWRFNRGDVAGAAAGDFDDTGWADVDLPHTWNALDGQDGGDDYWRGIGWYRKLYEAPAELAGRQLFVRFEGASLTTEVFINGAWAGRHEGGFSGFTFDVTDSLRPGAVNLIAVKVDNANQDDVAPISGPDVLHTGPDHTIFGGIYRGVDLVATDPVHVTLTDYGSPGVYVKQGRVTRDLAAFEVTTKVVNGSDEPRAVTVVADVLDATGALVRRVSDARQAAGGGGTVQFSQDVLLSDPHLWDGVRDPYLYEVVVRVQVEGVTVDEVRQPLGLRDFYIDPQQGFFLNGRRYDLRGVNLHQDRLDKGWAVSEADRAEDVSLLRELGATFVRLVHYPHDQQTYELLDRAGIIAWSEIPYNFEGTDSPAFDRNAIRQLREMIRQNYNHPSVLFWGLANAVNSTPHSNRLVARLDQVAAAEDPSRMTVLGTAVRVPQDAPLLRQTDLVGMNSYYGWYTGAFDGFGTWVDSFRARFPNRAIGVAEAGAGASIYQHEYNPDRPVPTGAWHPEEYQARFHESHWRQVKERPYLWSYAVFNLFDFASDDRDEGDAAGRNDKGLITYDRKTRKDSFYFYRANWSEEPTVYITSRRWAQRESRDVEEIKVYSNADAVELRVNGRSLGTLEGDEIKRFRWRDVRLDGGANVIEALATRGGETFTDSVIWIAPGGDAGVTGLTGTYFQNADFTDVAFTRTDRQIDFDWGAGSPGELLGSDTFSVRWAGRVFAAVTGAYQFAVAANDGSRLYVNGELLIDRFAVGQSTEHAGTIALEAGRMYDIVLEYLENSGNASARLSWMVPGRETELVPASRLFRG